MTSEKKWYTFYTKSRHEKKVQDILVKNGFEVYLPLHTVMKQWSDRRKKVEVPLFNSYIFVHESIEKIPLILQTPGIAWSVRLDNKPAVLHEKELEIIKRFLDSGLFLENHPLSKLEIGDPVKVVDGPLRGLSGALIKTPDGNKFTVGLESIGQTILVNLPASVLQKV